MENKEKLPSSDCDEDKDEDFNLLRVVNEYSEVIRLIEDDMAKIVFPMIMK